MVSRYEIQEPKCEEGDRVRTSVSKRDFENKYRNNWTREIFIIDKVLRTGNVPTYYIEALDGEKIFGRFYNQELLKTNF